MFSVVIVIVETLHCIERQNKSNPAKESSPRADRYETFPPKEWAAFPFPRKADSLLLSCCCCAQQTFHLNLCLCRDGGRNDATRWKEEVLGLHQLEIGHHHRRRLWHSCVKHRHHCLCCSDSPHTGIFQSLFYNYAENISKEKTGLDTKGGETWSAASQCKRISCETVLIF